MALKGAILESVDMKEKQIEAATVWMILLYHYPQDILKPHPITKYDALHTSVQKNSGHSEQLDHASFDQTLIFQPPCKKMWAGSQDYTLVIGDFST